MKRLLALSLIFITCTHQNDSVKLSKPQLDTMLHQVVNKTNDLFLQTSTDPLKKYLDSLEGPVIELGYDPLTVHWKLNKAQYFNYYQQYDSVNKLVNEIMPLLSKKDISQKVVLNFYIIYEGFLKDQGQLDSALKIAMNAYFLARKADTSRIGQTSLDLAVLYQKLDDLPKFRKFIFESWNHSAGEPEIKGASASGISYYYDRVNALDSAIYFFKISEKDSFWINRPEDLADILMNTAVFLLKKGNLKEGFHYQLKAKAILDSMGRQDIETYLNLGETYANMKQFKKAFQCIDSAKFLAQQANNYTMIRLSWKTKAEQYAKIPDYKKAMAALDSAYNRYTVENDSSLRKQANELETKYAVREKDNQINTLSITNAANLRVRNQQTIIIITISVVALLLGIIAVQFWRRRKTQMQLRETNLKQQILRTQLDPHFLSNSLITFKNLIREGEYQKVLGYLTSLAKLMRFKFENASEDFVLLKKEIEALDAYLAWQSFYRPDLFEYQINVYEGFEEDDIFIPPMLLQPVIENSIEHAFAQIDYKGFLSIEIQRRNHSVYCIIEDNGRGLQPGEDSKVHSTQINKERLALLSLQTGKPATLNVTNPSSGAQPHGVRVEIEIPFRFSKTS